VIDKTGKQSYNSGMNKKQATDLFGSTGKLAAALGITPQAIYQWPEKLDRRLSDEIIGAAIRLGKQLPKSVAA